MTGTYTEITEIVAPSEAVAGEVVNVEVKIKNTSSVLMGVMVGGALDYGVTPWPTISFPENIDNVAAGAIKSFYGSFTMPNSDVAIHAYSYYYGSDGYWHFDDELTKNISVTGLAAKISQFEIEDYSIV